ncbi:MAG: cobaltochelatase subunit CobN, partial [Desulfatitalea sp.]|nr:cobaltochelatase subunit CobN [Desulfatitalea sp.]
MLISAVAAGPVHGAGAIGLFVGDSDTLACVRALAELDITDTEIRIFTDEDIRRPDFEAFVRNMDVAVVDIMQSQPSGWLLEKRAIIKPDARIYAVRRSSRTDAFSDAGFKMDRTVRAYFDYTSAVNIANMIRFLAHRDLGVDTPHAPPMTPPENGLYHPDAPVIFPDMAAYAQWYRSSGRYREGALWNLTVIFPTSTLDGKKAPVDALIHAYESTGINTVTWMRAAKDWEKTLGRLVSSPPLADNLGSITGFAFKFSSIFTVDLLPVLQ